MIDNFEIGEPQGSDLEQKKVLDPIGIELVTSLFLRTTQRSSKELAISAVESANVAK